MFKVKYKRPEKLSDPHDDFNQATLKQILAKNDKDFTWSDYSFLYRPYAPAGTYEEVMYFLPETFLYLKTHENDALDLIPPIIWFCSENIDKLTKDGLAEIIKFEIMKCLNEWIKDFRIIHFDKDACFEKGWKFSHRDLVVNLESICEVTTELIKYKVFNNLAFLFFEQLTQFNNDPIKASWFLELSRARFGICSPPNETKITSILENEQLLNDAYDLIWPNVLDEIDSPTYWKDTFNQLNI